MEKLLKSRVDPQTGFAPTIWNAWETNWTGRDVTRLQEPELMFPSVHSGPRGRRI